jgi:enoyl-[acyl-carrier protein] reductase II
VVAEGFEAGGHNGREETTTLSLIPDVRRNIEIPLIAAGGIAVGSQMKAAMILGADGVQIGSRFAATLEASAHDNWKQKIVEAKEGDTQLTLKELAPVRLVKNKFFYELEEIYKQGKDKDALRKTRKTPCKTRNVRRRFRRWRTRNWAIFCFNRRNSYRRTSFSKIIERI